MALEEDLYTALGPLVAQRCYPVMFPQACTWPAIRYAIRRAPDSTICGSSGDDTSPASVQIDVVAATFDAARTLKGQVRTALAAMTTPHTVTDELPEFDDDARVHRQILLVEFHGSSSA